MGTPLPPWDAAPRITHRCSHPQDLDAECLRRTELETKLKGLQSFVELMRNIYEQVREGGRCPAEPRAWGREGRPATISSTPSCTAVNNPTCPHITHFVEHRQVPKKPLSQGDPVPWSVLVCGGHVGDRCIQARVGKWP